MTRNRVTGIRTSAIRVGQSRARTTCSVVAAFVFTALGASTAVAQDWPTKAIRAIVPLTAGSATDMIGRTVLDQLSQQLGQPIVVENRPGAGNTIGMATAARSDADGYTILINSSSHTIVPATYGNLPFDTLRDFTPVIPLGNMPTVLVVSPSKGYKNVADFVAAAKAKPGSMNYSTAGAGNFSHFASEVFRRAAGFQAVHPTFRPRWKRDFPTPNIISGSGCSPRRRRRLPSLTSCTPKRARRCKIPQCRKSSHAWARTP